MSIETLPRSNPRVQYPDSDGKPMADNTVQFRWIQTLQGGLEAYFRHDPQVFVAGDLLWYPVEGDNTLRCAPDVMVAFGRPKGDRGSYRQWEEGGIAPQVVFEILSPGNRAGELVRKSLFYQRYGVEEFYIYDPDAVSLDGWVREGQLLRDLAQPDGWTSPRMRLRFELSSGQLRVLRPDGEPIASYLELAEQNERERERAQRESERAQQESQRAQRESQRAQQESQRAQRESEAKERLAAQLRALGIEPEV